MAAMGKDSTQARGNSSRVPEELNCVFPVTTTYIVLGELKYSYINFRNYVPEFTVTVHHNGFLYS
jgi:hypothetical protein